MPWHRSLSWKLAAAFHRSCSSVGTRVACVCHQRETRALTVVCAKQMRAATHDSLHQYLEPESRDEPHISLLFCFFPSPPRARKTRTVSVLVAKAAHLPDVDCGLVDPASTHGCNRLHWIIPARHFLTLRHPHRLRNPAQLEQAQPAHHGRRCALCCSLRTRGPCAPRRHFDTAQDKAMRQPHRTRSTSLPNRMNCANPSSLALVASIVH